MGDFSRPGVKGVAQTQQPDAQHDDRPPADPVGQHPGGPDQKQAHDLRNPGKPAGNHAGNALVRDSKMLGEDVGLGKVHVRHHPDADQGCVHVGPEMPDPHARCELDLPYARAGAAVNVDHRMIQVPCPAHIVASARLPWFVARRVPPGMVCSIAQGRNAAAGQGRHALRERA